MSSLSTFPQFAKLPNELQIEIWKQAITDEHNDRVVALTYRQGHVILTDELMNKLSKFFSICYLSRHTVKKLYDVALPVLKQSGPGVVHLSTKLDIFLISPWAFTMGINIATNALFQPSSARLQPATLQKMKRVMEHQLDLGDLIYHPRPQLGRALFRSVKVCYLRQDHQRPTTRRLAAQIGGGPYTQMDLLRHYTNPDMYEKRTAEDDFEEERDE
ncbi:hypothetical protein PG993_003904 [Apiospora rasikravindrae]|uniref:2EXR domain-containing protein n=1 Tax=Apiospora rasikravindrae TaxID=990691 RepID=A0ABR1U3L0_9PEZI